MIDYILIAVAALSFLGIIFITLRKFTALSSINIKAIPKHKQDEIKIDIIEDRVNRRFKQLFSFFKNIFVPASKLAEKSFQALYNKAKAWEDFYKKSAKKPEEEEDVQSKIIHLIQEGEELIKQEDYAGAEKRFIEVISLDKKNIKGFENLGKVYFLQKQYEQSIDTFEYILRLNPKEVNALCELGEIAMAMSDRKRAISYFHKALDIEPNSPKCLSLLIETSIEEGNRNTAKKALKKLTETNPGNQNLNDYRKKIKEL